MRSSHFRTMTLAGVAPTILASLTGSNRPALAEITFEVVKGFELPGAYPSAALVLGSDGALYGTTSQGGASNYGTVFRIDAAATFSSLHSFDVTTHGNFNFWALVLGSDCALYGTTGSGGPGSGGVVYRVFEPGHLCQHLAFDPLPDRTLGDPPFTVSATSSAGLPVSFAASGSCSVTGETVSLTGAGLCTLTASQVGEADYEPAASPGAKGFRKAGSKGRNRFLWKTDPSWSGTCQELALPLIDGSVHPAYFSFESRPLAAARARGR